MSRAGIIKDLENIKIMKEDFLYLFQIGCAFNFLK